MSVGSKLRAWRKARRLTQKELGRRLGFSDKLISQHERDVGEPSGNFLQKSAELLGISVEELVADATPRIKETEAGARGAEQKMRDEQIHEYRAALLWLTSKLDEALLQKLRDEIWNEKDPRLTHAMKVLIMDSLVASRDKQQRRSATQN